MYFASIRDRREFIFYDQPEDPQLEIDMENRVQYCFKVLFKCSIQRGHLQPGSNAAVLTGWVQPDVGG